MLAKFEITSDIMQAAHWCILFSIINKMRLFWDHIVRYANLCIRRIRRGGKKGACGHRDWHKFPPWTWPLNPQARPLNPPILITKPSTFISQKSDCSNSAVDSYSGTDFSRDFGQEIKQGNYSLRGPPKLVIPQAVIGKDGLLYIQTCTSKQSYTARVRVDCAV